MSFANALSGMQAASYKLDVLGNNIANTETVGFKGSQARFSDLYSSALGAGQLGLGVRPEATATDFRTGSLEGTGRALDLAITGPGFFRFDLRGEASYSRDGQLTLTESGYLENARGARLVGHGTEGAGLRPLQVPFDPMPGKATTDMHLALNLRAGELSEAERLPESGGEADKTSPIVDSQGRMILVDPATRRLYVVEGETHRLDQGKVMDLAGNATDYPVPGKGGSDPSAGPLSRPEPGTIWVNAAGDLYSVGADKRFYDSAGTPVSEVRNGVAYDVVAEGEKGLPVFIMPTATGEEMRDADLGGVWKAPPVAEVRLEDPASYNYTAGSTVYGQDGTPYNVVLTFSKAGLHESTAGGGANASDPGRSVAWNEWKVDAFVYAENGSGQNGPLLASDSLTNLRFDVNGQPVGETPRGLQLDVGAEILAFTLDLSGSTQFDSASAVRDQRQDGYPEGEAKDVTIEADGRVVRHYTNDQTQVVGQVALAHFTSPQNLVQEGDNSWREGEHSGPAQMGLPGTYEAQGAVWGGLLSSAVETSNVQLNQELIDLLGAQRAYQVNSKSASVHNEMLQTAINLR